MRLGLITDIHEHVENLRAALKVLNNQRVDQIVVIGDVVEMGEHLEETCKLLSEANVMGVWGNHDFGLCGDASSDLRSKYSPAVFDFMNTLRPRLETGDCHFTHVEPWLNPHDIADLWYYDGLPDQPFKRDRIFSATPQRIMFAGHFHQWLIATPTELLDWHGDSTIRLDQGRYFVVIDALCNGKFATFDTDTSELVPYQLQANTFKIKTSNPLA